MALSIIRLELARDTDFPEGSSLHGYEFVAPLDGEGRIDADGWRAHRKRCRVRRFWEGEPDERRGPAPEGRPLVPGPRALPSILSPRGQPLTPTFSTP